MTVAGSESDPYIVPLDDSTVRDNLRIEIVDTGDLSDSGDNGAPIVIERILVSGSGAQPLNTFHVVGCSDAASANTNCAVAFSGDVSLLEARYDVVFLFTDGDGVATRLTFSMEPTNDVLTVDDGPSGNMISGQLSPVGGTNLFALPGVGSLDNPYRIPARTPALVRFTMLNSEGRTVDNTDNGYTITMVEYSPSGREADFVDDGQVPVTEDPQNRRAFVFTADCDDSTTTNPTNCTIAPNSRQALKTGGRYRITFLTAEDNGVVKRVQFYARVGNVVSFNHNNGDGTRTVPFRYRQGNTSTPSFTLLAGGASRVPANQVEITYRRMGASEFGAGTVVPEGTHTGVPFFVNGFGSRCGSNDCRIDGRTGSGAGELRTIATGLYVLRVKIRSENTGYLFFFVDLLAPLPAGP